MENGTTSRVLVIQSPNFLQSMSHLSFSRAQEICDCLPHISIKQTLSPEANEQMLSLLTSHHVTSETHPDKYLFVPQEKAILPACPGLFKICQQRGKGFFSLFSLELCKDQKHLWSEFPTDPSHLTYPRRSLCPLLVLSYVKWVRRAVCAWFIICSICHSSIINNRKLCVLKMRNQSTKATFRYF